MNLVEYAMLSSPADLKSIMPNIPDEFVRLISNLDINKLYTASYYSEVDGKFNVIPVYGNNVVKTHLAPSYAGRYVPLFPIHLFAVEHDVDSKITISTTQNDDSLMNCSSPDKAFIKYRTHKSGENDPINFILLEF